jgi:nitrogenase-stabilizing/protective protein
VPTTELTARLLACRDAEDYFAILEVPFDPHVLRVSRLHILRLFGPALQAYLTDSLPEDLAGGLAGAAGGLAGAAGRGADSPAARRLREALAAAHGVFASSTALDHRLFKVLQDRAPGPARTFVPLDCLAVEEPAPDARRVAAPAAGSAAARNAAPAAARNAGSVEVAR